MGLGSEQISILKDQRLRSMLGVPAHRLFANVDKCLKTIGVDCKRLPYLWDRITGLIKVDGEVRDWFNRTYPSHRIRPPQDGSQSAKQPLAPTTTTSQSRPRSIAEKSIQRIQAFRARSS